MRPNQKLSGSQRLFISLLGLPVAVCIVGCSHAYKHRATYSNGISVEATHDGYDTLFWVHYWKKPLPLPSIVVHLGGKDLDSTQLSSDKAMRELGGVVRYAQGDDLQVELRLGHTQIDTTYTAGNLRLVMIRTMGGRTSVTVDGKDLTIPASKDEVLRAFGEPAQAQTEYTTGIGSPPRTEDHL